MKCCCDKILNLGCFSNCEVIKIEFETEADVAYKLYINANGRESFFNINSVDGGIEIDTSMLNESAISILSLYKADNEQVLFGEYDCLQLSISVVQGLSSSSSGGGGTQPCNGKPLCSIQAGDNITIDNTNPQSPLISSTGGGGIPDAPSDGKLYGRENGAWQEVIGGDFNLEIGTPIDNSTAKSVLFVDDAGKLGEITNFQYDEVADSLTFMHNDIGLLLNSETEVDDGVFTNLNGIAKMVDGVPTAFVGVTDLSIFVPSFGYGVLINSYEQVLINSVQEVTIISDEVSLGGEISVIKIDENILFMTEGGEFRFVHQADPVFGDYMIKLFKHDDTLVDSTVYSAGSGVDDATWDGYTIGQLFQAMKNMGFLA